MQGTHGALTSSPTAMPLRWPRKLAWGKMTEVRAREANGAASMGSSSKPSTLNLASLSAQPKALSAGASLPQSGTGMVPEGRTCILRLVMQ